MKRTIITLDGLAGTGKTSTAERLAERLGFLHFSTGLLYRAVGLLALREGIGMDSPDECSRMLKSHSIEVVQGVPPGATVLIDGEDVFSELYTPQVSEATSKVSRFPEVRQVLLHLQREAFPGKNMVVEGRDVGSVVFPDAALKFFLTTNEDVKVQRRLEQLQSRWSDKGSQEYKDLEKQMKIEIHERDKRDCERTASPTVSLPDMVVIDNSALSLEKVVENMYNLVGERGISVSRDHGMDR